MTNPKLAYFFLLNMVVFYRLSESRPGWIDDGRMSQDVYNFVNQYLGAAEFQEYINRKNLTEEPLKGQELLNMFIALTSGRLKKILGATNKIKAALIKDLEDGAYPSYNSDLNSTQCCMTPEKDLLTPYQFGKEVNPDELCLHFPNTSSSDVVVPETDNLLKVMQNNRLEYSEVKWQYFGTEQGVFVIHPRLKDNDCEGFDPRYRPWYTQTLSSNPKDIVVVFDRSESVDKKGSLSVIKNCTLALLQTLNVADRIGLVGFSDRTVTPPGKTGETCYYSKLAFATPANKDYLASWLNGLSGYGTSQYKDVFPEAFKFFDESDPVSRDTRPRSQIILFVSDGIQDWVSEGDAGVLDQISQENAKLNNTVTITTYGVYTEEGSQAEILLRNISQQTKADLSRGPVTPGQFIRIDSAENVRALVGSFYDTLNTTGDRPPFVTSPYLDYFGLGIVMSVCTPVIYDGHLRGVACFDIRLSEITREIESIHHGRDSYAFKYDNNGKILIHPLDPNPVTYNNGIFLYIDELETEPQVKEMINNKRGTEGRMSLVKRFVRARGNSTTDGITTVQRNATYFWKQVGTFHPVVVISDSDRNVSVPDTKIASTYFVYHRLDKQEDISKCSANSRLSTLEHSVVKLTAFAFKTTLDYFAADTTETINMYRPYFTSKEQVEHKTFKFITKQMIALSEKLDELWLNIPRHESYIYWRYYGDYYGHIRVFPGVVLPKEYDHTKRNFFVKAVANGNVITITPPYEDVFGAGVVLSVLVPIFVRSTLSTENSAGTLLGVLGIDVNPLYMKYSVENMFEACKNTDNACFLVDNSGYMVYHSKTDYKNYLSNTVPLRHITEEEPTIAKYLIEKGHLIKKECLEFGYMKRLLTWQLQLKSRITAYDIYPFFELFSVPKTNLFLGIKNEIKSRTEVATCTCPEKNPAINSLFQCPADQCTCPCANSSNYDFCSNDFQVTGSSPEPCVPQPPVVSLQSPVADEHSLTVNLPACYQFDCSAATTEMKCSLLPGECQWCPATKLCTNKSCPSAFPLVPVITSAAVVLLVVAVSVGCFIRRRSAFTCCQSSRMPKPGEFMPNVDEGHDTKIN